jgi:hypothetical protein
MLGLDASSLDFSGMEGIDFTNGCWISMILFAMIAISWEDGYIIMEITRKLHLAQGP